MNKLYEDIIRKFGEPASNASFTEEERLALRKSFPDQVADFCFDIGRSVLREGLIQSCHPDDMRGVLALIFGADRDFSHDNCHAFAYSAFGVIFFWMKDYGYGNISVYEGRLTQKNFVKGQPAGATAANAVSVPFWLSDQALDFEDGVGKPLFKRASKKLGFLETGECYGFVPALALGGVSDIAHLKRLKASEHFAIVAQTMEYNLIDVQGYGQSVVVRPIGPR
ncbi:MULTISPECIES: T6SS immunity protein Tdi1 domain-containing protein [unclassified Rhizobium]|uniref:T6SS immunity protein Tdi1 domain-containing protein n=1 Tax=unclassified Rhizobium TaxID=2613769 RepID=UPI000BA86BC0|nr:MULTISPECIES: T6SS immunity protein Tdi1 domain-containing protein [unclassified Rhizobium]ASW09848.1 hypothetical protein CKA34_27885 [Rhizobium sp. 11515TR]MDK4715966.1 DUF1851 domain-containing protein [Rhizobium sp. CNPSo 4039]